MNFTVKNRFPQMIELLSLLARATCSNYRLTDLKIEMKVRRSDSLLIDCLPLVNRSVILLLKVFGSVLVLD